MTTPPTSESDPVDPEGASRRLASVPPAPPPNGNRSLVIRYGAVCAALVVVLAGLAIYGFLIKKSEVNLSTPGGEDLTTAPTGNWGGPQTGPPSEGTDGPLSFTVHGTETGPTIVQSEPPLEKTAKGEYIVVHMTVTNAGPDAATFEAKLQTLHAGDATYQPDDEATGYLGGTSADLAPGATKDVWIAFDVPSGAEPERIELHGQPGGPGVQVPLP